MNWKNITLEQYQNVITILNTDIAAFNKEVELVQYLFNYTKDEVLSMPLEKFKVHTKQLDFLTKAYEGNMTETFTLNEVEYIVCWEVQKRTAGQFIDLSELTKEQELINDNLHKILAVICIPKGSKYNGDILERAEVFKSLTMDIVFPISSFFFQVLKSSLPVIQDYLMKDIQKKKNELMEMIKDTSSIGVGTAH